jgi:hypothetical protein
MVNVGMALDPIGQAVAPAHAHRTGLATGATPTNQGHRSTACPSARHKRWKRSCSALEPASNIAGAARVTRKPSRIIAAEQGRLFAFLGPMGIDAGMAEETAQEAFLRL